MRKILFGISVFVLGVAFVVPGLAKKPIPVSYAMAKSEVLWSVPGYIELSVSADSFTFPEFDPGTDEYLAKDAVTLFVTSNTEWSLSYSLEGDEEAVTHLSVLLGEVSGSGNASVPVSYRLSGLRAMPPGDYSVTVIYTATAK
ncbi:hypothetical protein H5T52_07495 [Candidatus Bipolaricaulota bacterium]|nr:hypothetical protein [Candidatus Bipolaricaulota bacterium]